MTPELFDGPNGRMAYERIPGDRPGVVWLGGFRSDMTGTKASRLADWARGANRAFLRFDYTGHGASDGAFEDGTIGDWATDAKAAIEQLTDGAQILVGSSMGAWIACLLAKATPEKFRGIVLIAPAPDFTEALMLPGMSASERETLMRDGRLVEPSPYDDEPTVITRQLIEDGRKHLVLKDGVPFQGPVRILQGMADEDVPWDHAMRTAEAFASDDVEIYLTKTGDHRLSTDQDLDRLETLIAAL